MEYIRKNYNNENELREYLTNENEIRKNDNEIREWKN